MAEDINSLVQILRGDFHSKVEEELQKVPVGKALCVHEPTYKTTPTENDEYLVKFEVHMHVVEALEDCGASVRRTQYLKE